MSDGSSDLYATNYDPIDHLNQLFDDPSSLADLPDLLNYTNNYNNKLVQSIQSDQQQYNDYVESLSNSNNSTDEGQNNKSGQNDSLSFEELRKTTAALAAEILHTRQMATTTEESITNMTCKIQNLDQCKKNLVLSMTVLKRLQMLLSAYEQLAYLLDDKKFKKRKHYGEILNLISVVLELNNHFKSYKSIDEINALSKNIHDLKVKLTNSIFDDFDRLINDDEDDDFINESDSNDEAVDGDRYNDEEISEQERQKDYISACKILDTLGGPYRSKLTSWFCNHQLKEIRTIFGNLNDEAGSIENISRRFLFFKKILKNYNDQFRGYFPKDWNVDQELSLRFCEFNQVNIHQHLNLIDQTADFNVNIILESLTETINFENYLTEVFAARADHTEFSRKISSSFEPFLKIWLADQDKVLESKMLDFVSQANLESISKNQENELTNVFPSSADLFRLYRNIITQLIKLSNGSILLDLTDLFNKYLERYLSQVLKPLVPDSNDVLSNSGDEAIRYLGLIVNTCDYINSTVIQLGEMLESLINPEFKSQLEGRFEATNGLYLLLISESLGKILLKIELDCELSWREMLNHNWKHISEVSDSSRYIINLIKTLTDDLTLALQSINKNGYIRNLLDRLIDLLIEKFLINLVKLKPINDTMPSQILFDLSVLKKFFKKLPMLNADQSQQDLSQPNTPLLDSDGFQHAKDHNNGSHNETNSIEKDAGKKINFTVTKSYLNHMNNQFLKLEQVLKVLMVNGKDYSGLINNYLCIILDSNFDNFAKILILKGVISQSRPIHSTEKKELLKYRELFEQNVKQLGDDLKLSENNAVISNIVIDVNSLPPTLTNSRQLTATGTGTPPANSLKNFSNVLQASPLMAGSLQSLSPNINFASFMNKNNASPNFNKENFEKNLKEFAITSETSVKSLNENFKSNFGKFFNRGND